MSQNFFHDIQMFIQKIREEFDKEPKIVQMIKEQCNGIQQCKSVEEIFIYLNTLFFDICKNKTLSEKIRNDIC